MDSREVKVLSRFGAYRKVTIGDVERCLTNESQMPEVHHVNAIGELADLRFNPLLLRALQSPDHLVLKAASRVAVKLKLFELAPVLRKLSLDCAHPLTSKLLAAGACYLEEPDRGLSLIVDQDPLALYLTTNLLAVNNFDRTDFLLASGALLQLARRTLNKLAREEKGDLLEAILDAINGVARALQNDQIANTVSFRERHELREALQIINNSQIYTQLDTEVKNEIAIIDEIVSVS